MEEEEEEVDNKRKSRTKMTIKKYEVSKND